MPIGIGLTVISLLGALVWIDRPTMRTTTYGGRAEGPASELVTVVGLGDSVTAGARCSCRPFVDRLAALVAGRDRLRVRAVNLGVNGLTAAALVKQLQQPVVSRSVAAGDVVVITIGANDLQPQLDRWDSTQERVEDPAECVSGCASAAVDDVGTAVEAVLARVRQLRAGRPTRVLVTGYWNVFADGATGLAHRGPAYLRWSDALTRRLNTSIRAAAAAQDATYVDLYAPFKGDGSEDPTALLADDGDHPDGEGHQLIAQALFAALPSLAPRGAEQVQGLPTGPA